MGSSGPLGIRMKQYESVQTSNCLIQRIPVIVRVDGRAFHTLTAKMDKPFDRMFMDCMVDAAKEVAREMQGFKFGYVQSDEASFLLTDFDTLTTEPWFGYDLCKVVSISASLMTSYFNMLCHQHFSGIFSDPPVFDSRAFNVPIDEVANYFLWRMKDWERNSVQMYARSFFSHKELHKKDKADIHEMLHAKGKNWATDLNAVERNGTCLIKETIVTEDKSTRSIISENPEIFPHFESVNAIIAPLLKVTDDGKK